MRPTKTKRRRLGVGLALAMSVSVTGAIGAQTPAGAVNPPATGVACTTSIDGQFALDATTGYIDVADGNTMFMWGYAPAGGHFQYPGPVLCVDQGDTVTITLHNSLSEDTSIMFPGQEGVLANGVPAQPQFDGGGSLTSLTDVAPANGGSMEYTFTAANPGTYIYESGTNPEKQVRLGLAGALIVRPTMGAAYAYDRADDRFTPEEEFLVFLSEIDPYQHMAAEEGKPFDLTTYHPHYWLLNGRTFPDTLADNYSARLPNQPYGALVKIHPYDATDHPYPGIARYINVGFEDVPFHPHGNNGLIIGRDGHALEDGGQDLSYEKFAVNIGPQQTWDVLFRWYDAEDYSEDNPVPVTIPDVANQQFGQFYGGSPYLGQQGPLPPGASTLNECGEYYIISHNHALFQLDAWGMTMAGQITYLRVDPPLPNDCP